MYYIYDTQFFYKIYRKLAIDYKINGVFQSNNVKIGRITALTGPTVTVLWDGEESTVSVLSEQIENVENVVPALIIAPENNNSPNYNQLCDLRCIYHASCLAKGMNPNLMESVFGDKNLLIANKLLIENNIACNTKSTISNDFDRAINFIDEAIKMKIDDDPITLIVDGASLKHSKAIAVNIGCPALQAPILAHVIHPENIFNDDEENTTYNFKIAATNLEKVLEKWNIRKERVVTVVGDNVVLNTAIARELGIQQGHCRVHAWNLIVKNGHDFLPLYNDLVVKSSQIIHAGGSTKRLDELKNLNFDVGKLKYYSNRFASIVDAAGYRLDNFYKFSEWIQHGKSLPLGTNDDDDDDDVENISASFHAVKTAYANDMSKLSLAIGFVLYNKIPELITLCSIDNLEKIHMEEILSLEEIIIQKFINGQQVMHANLIIDDAIAKAFGNAKITNELRTAAYAYFVNGVQSACVAAVRIYDKLIKPDLLYYDLKMKFDVKSKPIEISELTTAADFQNFFIGNSTNEELVSICRTQMSDLVVEYQQYMIDYNEHPNIAKSNNFEYWNSKRKKWKCLTKIALWWACIFLSSIAAERTFGIAKLVDNSIRGKLSWESFTTNLKFRVNGWVISNLLEITLTKFSK